MLTGREVNTRRPLARPAKALGCATVSYSLLLALGCASTEQPPPTPTPSPTVTPTPTPSPTPTPPVRSAGCGLPAPAGLRTLTINAGGRQRDYRLLAPTTYDPQKALALVFAFHGGSASADVAMKWELQDATGAASSAIFVFPQGIYSDPLHPEYGANGWDESCGGYDMPFFDAMLEATASSYCVNPQRVFATGFSWGADFANNLACCRGDKLRAIAPASGDDAHYNATCGTTVPAFRITYGDADPDYAQSYFADVVDWERTAHGCSDAHDAVSPAPCIAYRSCSKPVIECKYAGMGHARPEDWAAATWNFFASFP
jgi:polyhydroxybutyrate depolymerase